MNFFPVLIIAMFLGAAVGCALAGAWNKALFYLFSALLNVNVYLMR